MRLRLGFTMPGSPGSNHNAEELGMFNLCRLPREARRWLVRIEQRNIRYWIEEAAAIRDMQPGVRGCYVLNEVRDYAKRELCDYIPSSIARLLVEYVYQIYKASQAGPPS